LAGTSGLLPTAELSAASTLGLPTTTSTALKNKSPAVRGFFNYLYVTS